MKKEYSSLEIELFFLANEDVITTSPTDFDVTGPDVFEEE